MNNDLLKDRAWAEVDFNNLEHNINEIKKIISSKTKIMAVVKANAYGHGLVGVSRKLNEIGIMDFAVATLEEGIILRENGIRGNILILGYTSLENVKYVIKYDLIQTIVDVEYALGLLRLNFETKLKVNIKVNTGMNRIGISYNNIDFIKKLYKSNRLNILGIFSHFCASDSSKKSDINFSKKQIEKFDNLIKDLKSDGIDVGQVHMQSSYGIVNYPECCYDYVRCGIFMYGIHSEYNSYSKIKLDIRPVLSVKAHVTSVKKIKRYETVSYGRKYKASKDMMIATVSIGYGDGIPRSLSCKNSQVMVNGRYASIIGRICMDQLIIDASNISDIKQGDIVTLIGDNDNIRAVDMSRKANTITNELLCRLGSRLKYVFIDK